MNLEGTTVLVTGGAIRLGRCMVEYLGKAGARIVVHYNQSAVEAERLSKTLTHLSIDHCLVSADLSKQNGVAKLLDNIPDAYSEINILINSAAIFPDNDKFGECSSHWDALMSMNARAPILLIEALAIKHNSKLQQVVNILDARSQRNQVERPVYRWSKHILAQATKDLALTLAPNVRVNGIALGAILPPQTASNDHLDRLVHSIPLEYSGNPTHLVQALQSLLQNDFMTGAILPVDGGEFL